MKKKYVYIGIGILLTATALYLFVFRVSAEEINYRTEKISRGDIVIQVRATGTMNPVMTVQVGSQVSGILSKINVDFNSHVKTGQVIAQIDSTFLAASVKEAEGNLDRTQAQVNESRRNLSRMKELFSKNLISQAEMDAAQTNYETAQAQLKQSQASVERANVNLRYSIIRSPIDGIVISRDVDVGQTVAASLQSPKLFVIANDLKKMQVEASIDEADIGNIEIGQEVTFSVDAHPNREFKGTVIQIRLAPQTVQNVVTYTVIIEVPNPDLKLMPGMTATVSILINEKNDVLRVPALAFRFQPPPDILEKGEKELIERFAKRDSAAGGEGMPDSARMEAMKRFRSMGGGQGQRPEMGQMGGFSRREGGRGGRGRMFQRVWVMEGKNKMKLVPVRTGITDNRYFEVLGGELKEDDEVIIGMDIGAGSGQRTQTTNPFAPTTGGPGSRGMR